MRNLPAFLGGLLIAVLLLTQFGNYRLKPVAVARLPDGGTYTGELKDGELHGRGRIIWPNGVRYEGEFVEGLFQGRGHYERPDGVVYDGEFARGDMNGWGVMVLSPTRRYEGEFVDGTFSGHGTYVTDRETYRGEFRDDVYNGKGQLDSVDGDSFTGEFVAGQFHGQGMFRSAAGDVYAGRFEHGVLSGPGTFKSADGDTYVGDFLDWKFNGHGTYTNARGDQYIGSFVGGEFTGEGRYVGKDGSRYRGGFRNWQYEGPGLLRLPEGDAYKGDFRVGEYHGAGTLSYARPLDGRSFVSGEWREGRLVRADDRSLLVNPEQIAELALYNQRELLDGQLAGLAPGDPRTTDLYFLGIAGDGTAGVFRREVLYLKRQFDQQMGTMGRSLALVNGDLSVRKFPLATHTSLQRAIQALATAIDPAQDLLFLYLSSHGTEQHHAVLDLPGVSLPDLSPTELATMLAPLRDIPKIVVISACFSGGFVPALSDDNTLVITSAAVDRNSFGCSDLSDFTYFGEAFFKQALPQHGADLAAAFESAATLVGEREAAADFMPSQPQIHRAPAVEDRWRLWYTSRHAPVAAGAD